MERNLKTTRLSHVIGYRKETNQEQQGNNQTALIKGEIKCRKERENNKEQIAPNGIGNTKMEENGRWKE